MLVDDRHGVALHTGMIVDLADSSNKLDQLHLMIGSNSKDPERMYLPWEIGCTTTSYLFSFLASVLRARQAVRGSIEDGRC